MAGQSHKLRVGPARDSKQRPSGAPSGSREISSDAAELRRQGEELAREMLAMHTAASGGTVSLDAVSGLIEEETSAQGGPALEIALLAARMGTWRWDPETGAIRASEAMSELLGLAPTTAFATSADLWRLVHEDDLDRHRALVERAVAQRFPWRDEFRIVRARDGRVAWLEERAFPVRNRKTGKITVAGVMWEITERKRAEEALRLSEEKYRTLFSSISQGFCIVEVLFRDGTPYDFRFLETNPAFAKLSGLEGQVEGRTVLDLLLPDEEGWAQLYGRIALGGEPVRYESPVSALGRHFDIYAFPVGDLGQRRVGILFNDITERKRREANLRFLAELGTELVELSTSDQVIQATGRKLGNYLQVSLCYLVEIHHESGEAVLESYWRAEGMPDLPAKVSLSQFMGDECAAHSEAQTFVEADLQHSGHPAASAYAQYGVRSFVKIPLHIEGAMSSMLAVCDSRPREWRSDEVDLIREVAHRVAPRVLRARAEAALRESEARLRLILESARDYAIISTDLNGIVSSWSFGAHRVFGFSEAEVTGRSVDLIFTPEDRAIGSHMREVETALRDGRAVDERWHLRKNGERFWGSGVLMAMRDPSGEVMGFVKVLRDQTQAKQHQEALAASRVELERALEETRQAREEAEAANRTKDDFLATLSHELRTPLMPVLLTAESLLRLKELPLRVRKGLEIICRNVELETHFINDLLDLTRISRGKLDLVREPVDLHAVLAAALAVCEADLRAKNHVLSVQLKARQTCVLGDGPRLQQVFWNLLQNASKFTPPGGRITVRTRNDNAAIVVTVSDTGIGIESAELSGIFQAFHQANSDIYRQYGGLGLGLAICKATVHELRGEIRAESEGPGRGTSFTVRLPLTTPGEANVV